MAKSPGRGQYRRRRERRPLCGMMVHLDASRPGWLPQLPMQDLVVAMDDADGRILYARFVPEENTASTLAALKHLLRRYGRFAELYTDRASHFCYTPKAGTAPPTEHGGAVSRALKVLGIRQLLAWSPQARGRSERAFGTIQGRLPPELRVAGSGSYEHANTYLEQVFVPDFNRRFTAPPAQPGRAFLPLVGVDLEVLLSEQHARTVQNDSTVSFKNRVLQLPRTRARAHYVRCQVTVHEFPEGGLGIQLPGAAVGLLHGRRATARRAGSPARQAAKTRMTWCRGKPVSSSWRRSWAILARVAAAPVARERRREGISARPSGSLRFPRLPPPSSARQPQMSRATRADIFNC